MKCKKVIVRLPGRDREKVMYGLVIETDTHYEIKTRNYEHVFRKDCIISIETTDIDFDGGFQ